jgi:hypothetical protein
MTFDVAKTLPQSIKGQRSTAVKLGNLAPAFAVAKTVPASLKVDRKTAVKLGNLAPAFAPRRPVR